MNPQLLQNLGLSKSQAITYLRLVENGELSPPQVAKLTGESRSNAYMILQRLEDLDLIEKKADAKKLTYLPLNPVALENLAENKRRQSTRIEQEVKHHMPQMLSYFYSFTERPGIRLLQGIEGLKEIHRDTLRTKKDIYFMRTLSEVEHLGDAYFDRYKAKRAALGITTYAYTVGPFIKNQDKDDKIHKMVRTWIDPKDYTAPVEINVYGDKTAFLVYGEDIMGVIIQSAQIASSMRQMFRIISNNGAEHGNKSKSRQTYSSG